MDVIREWVIVRSDISLVFRSTRTKIDQSFIRDLTHEG